MAQTYDLLNSQLACIAKFETLDHSQGGRIADGIASTMRRVLGLISKRHLLLGIEPSLSGFDVLIDLWALYADLESQLSAVHALARMRSDVDEQAAA